MGVYDQLLPSSGKYISTYAGTSIEETAALGETITKNFERGMEGVSAYNIMRNNVMVSGKDEDLKDQIFDESYKGIESYAERGDYENAIPAIMNATNMVSSDKDLRKAMSNYQQFGKHQEFADKLLAEHKIDKFQYNIMVDEMGKYEGVKKSNNVRDFLYMPAKSISMYDKFVDAGQSVDKSKGAVKRIPDPVTGKIIEVVVEGRDPEAVQASIDAVIASDPEFKGYYNDLVKAYGEEKAMAMVQEDVDAAFGAVTPTKIDNQYIGISRGNNDGGDGGDGKVVQFGATPSQKVSGEVFDGISEGHQSIIQEYNKAKAMIEEIEASGGTPNEGMKNQLKLMEQKLKTSQSKMTSIIEANSSDYDYSEGYEKFQDGSSRDKFEEAGIDYPESKEEYIAMVKDYATKDIETLTAPITGSLQLTPSTGLTPTIIGGANQISEKSKIDSFFAIMGKELKDHVSSKREGDLVSSAEGYTLSSDTGGYIENVNSTLNKSLKKSGLGAFLTFEGDTNLTAAMEDINMEPNSESLSLTTVYDENGNNVYNFSYIDKDDGQRKAILVKSGKSIISQDATSKVSKAMQQVLSNPNSTPEEKVIAGNYLAESIWTPALIKADVRSGASVDLKVPDGSGGQKSLKLPFDSANPSKKGNVDVTVQRTTNGLYEITLTNSDGTVKKVSYASLAEVSQQLAKKNNQLLESHK